jgi:hypothetical protein
MNRIDTLPSTVYSVEGPNRSRKGEALLLYPTRASAQAAADRVNRRNANGAKLRRVVSLTRERVAERAAAGEIEWVGYATPNGQAEMVYASPAFIERSERGEFYEG